MPTEGAKRIFIVEDHLYMREMLRQYLAADPRFDVCGAAATGEEALETLISADAAEADPAAGAADLMLVDMSLPGMSGADVVRALLERRPALRCLMYSGHSERRYVEQALSAGAHGYVLKGDPDELAEAIERVLSGETYFSGPLKT